MNHPRGHKGKYLASSSEINSASQYFGRKDSDRYHQLPLWFIKSGIYLELTKNQFKLYLFFVSKADKYSRETPEYAVYDLSCRCDMHRKFINPSIFDLAARKLIRPARTGRRIKVIVLFDPPPGLYIQLHQRKTASMPTAEEDSLNRSTLKAKVLNRRSHSEMGDNLSQLRGQFVTVTETLRDAECDKLGQTPEEIPSKNTISPREQHTPGEDIKEHNDSGGY